jgi:hypothetical protein
MTITYCTTDHSSLTILSARDCRRRIIAARRNLSPRSYPMTRKLLGQASRACRRIQIAGPAAIAAGAAWEVRGYIAAAVYITHRLTSLAVVADLMSDAHLIGSGMHMRPAGRHALDLAWSDKLPGRVVA